MPINKNQHYVPQFYLRRFSNDGKTIGVYIVDKFKTIPNASIRNQASESYFYTTETDKSENIELALSKIEKIVNEVIKRLDKNQKYKLTKEEWVLLYVFTIIQLGRTIAPIEETRNLSNITLQSILKAFIEISKNSNNPELADFKNIPEGVVNSITLKDEAAKKFTLGSYLHIIPTCIDLKGKVLINETGMPFITSDNPVCLYNPFMEKMKYTLKALGARGTIIYFPLSPNLALIYYDDRVYKVGARKQGYARIYNLNDIKELNKLSLINSHKVVFYRQDLTNISNIEQQAKAYKDLRLEESVKCVNGVMADTGNQVIGATINPYWCNFKVEFIKYWGVYSTLTPVSFNPSCHRYREIANHKDELVESFFKSN